MAFITGKAAINKPSIDPTYYLDVSGNLNVDGSIYVKGTAFVGGNDTSLGNLSRWEVVQDASIVSLRTVNNTQDTSLGNLSRWAVVQDASVVSLRSANTTQDTSLGNLSRWEVAQDASIVSLRAVVNTHDSSLSPSSLLSAIKTVDGAGSGLDADTLDTVHLSNIIYGQNQSGSNTANATIDASSEVTNYKSGFWEVTGAAWTPTTAWYWGLTAAHTSNSPTYNYGMQIISRYDVPGNLYTRNYSGGSPSSWYKVWTENNDGTGSGLDADLWDGNQFASYLNQAVLTTSNVTHNSLKSTADASIGASFYLLSPGTSTESNVLYYNSTTKKVTYGATPSATLNNPVSWASGTVGSNNYMITANGDGSIVAESKITFNGSTLTVGSAIDASTLTLNEYLYGKASGTAERYFNIIGSADNYYATHVHIAGSNSFQTSHIYIRGGGTATSGNVYIGQDPSGTQRGDTYLMSPLTTCYDYTSGSNCFLVDGSVGDGAVAVFKNANVVAVSAGNHRRVVDMYNTTGYGSVTDYIRFYVGTTGDGYVSNSSGTLGFVQESDIDLKTNIVPTETDSLDVLTNIEIVDFDWKDAEKDQRCGRQTGVIAQQVASVYAPMVSFRDTLSVMYEVLHPHYIKAIQQLSEKIKALEEEVSILKSK